VSQSQYIPIAVEVSQHTSVWPLLAPGWQDRGHRVARMPDGIPSHTYERRPFSYIREAYRCASNPSPHIRHTRQRSSKSHAPHTRVVYGSRCQSSAREERGLFRSMSTPCNTTTPRPTRRQAGRRQAPPAAMHARRRPSCRGASSRKTSCVPCDVTAFVQRAGRSGGTRGPGLCEPQHPPQIAAHAELVLVVRLHPHSIHLKQRAHRNLGGVRGKSYNKGFRLRAAKRMALGARRDRSGD